MPALLLKLVATGLTVVASIASALYVSGHVKNGAAPLHPPVIGAETSVQSQGGRLMITPKVKAGNVQAVTTTYAS